MSQTFGNINIESNDNTAGYGQLNVCRFQCTETGILTALDLYCEINAGSPHVSAVVYSDNNGAPDALLGQGTSTPAPASFGWLQLGGLNIPVTSGTYYWLGFWVGGSGYGDVISYANTQDSTTNEMAYLFWNYSAPPTSFGMPVGYATWMASIYATVTITVNYTLAIPTVTGGTTSPSGTLSYVAGTAVPVTAAPISGYIFDHWILDGVNYTDNPITVTMSANHTLTPVFMQTVQGGTTNPTPGSYVENANTVVSVTAIPNPGYMLAYWMLDAVNVGSANPYLVTMNAAHNLQAMFQTAPTTVIIVVVAGSNGSVSPSGPQTLTIGQTYPFEATPNSGYAFNYWDLNGTNISSQASITLTASSTINGETLTAHFVQTQITLTIVAGANGAVSPVGAQKLTIGNTYSFAAIPSAGYQLDHWDLAGKNMGSTNPLPLVAALAMNNETLTAVFTAIPPQQISLTIATIGNGTVNLANGPHTFNVGDTVTFTAIAASQYAFSQWTLGVAIYQTNPLSLQISAGMNGLTLTAVFVETTVTINVVAGADGSVTPAGSASLNIGQSYLFAATPDPDYSLDHWDLGGASVGSSNPLTLTATAAMNGEVLTAIFAATPPRTISITLAVSAGGTTNPAPAQHTFNIGDTVTINALPDTGYALVNWKLNGTVYSVANPLQLPITADLNNATLTANFTSTSKPSNPAAIAAGLLGSAGAVLLAAAVA